MHAVSTSEQQLTLDIKPDPRVVSRKHPLITGSIKLKGSLRVGQNLNAGDRLVVLVQNADGEVLSHHEAEVEYVASKPIRDHGDVIGAERIHHAEIR